MRRATQLAIAGVAVVTVGIGGIVLLNQKQQIAQQEQAIDQQAILARLLKERNAEDERFHQQQEAIAMQLKSLDAEQARNAAKASADRASLAASEKASMDRQRLERKIQELKNQQVERAHQTECTLIQMRLRMAESIEDAGLAKALKDRWNANCASS
ncbi:MAG: hypothetical protein ACK6BG_03960 [Cyanobacteriota bacterium]